MSPSPNEFTARASFGILAVRGEEDIGLGVGGGEGEDVPDVGDYICGGEVDLDGLVILGFVCQAGVL